MKQSCRCAGLPLKPPGKALPLQLLVAAGHPRFAFFVAAQLQLLSSSYQGCLLPGWVSVSLFPLQRTAVSGSVPTLFQCGLMLTYKDPISNNIRLWGSEWTWLWEHCLLQHNCHSHSLTLVSLCWHGLLVFVCKGFHLSDECVSALSLSHIQLLASLWTVACQAPLSMGFSRQGYWSGEPFPSPGGSSQPRDRTWVSCIAGGFFTIWAIREALMHGVGLMASSAFGTPLQYSCLQNPMDGGAW